MKFAKATLISNTRTQISVLEAEIKKYQAKVEVENKERLSDWNAKYANQWVEFADAIKAIIKKGEVITPERLPSKFQSAYRIQDMMYSESRILPENYHERNIANLKALVSALEAVKDEEITTSGLKDIGFNPDRIRSIFG